MTDRPSLPRIDASIAATAVVSPSSMYQTFPVTPPTAPPSIHKYFKLFPYLQEELQLMIISYVAYAPFETMPEYYPKSPLTDEMPIVSRRFRSMCNSDILWKDAVVRISKKEPRLWKNALRTICNDAGGGGTEDESGTLTTSDENKGEASQSKAGETIVELVERTHRALRAQAISDPSSLPANYYKKMRCDQMSLHSSSSVNDMYYKWMYEQVVNQHLRFTGPVFIMPGQVALGQSYPLHLFEFRYRLLIAEAMAGQPHSARNGGPLPPGSSPVYFIHANRTPLERSVPAVLVQVIQCQLYPDGRADVVLLPVHYMWLERLWVRPNSGNLHYAQCLKMGHTVTKQMNHLQRQEALATAMNQVVEHLIDSDDEGDDADFLPLDHAAALSEDSSDSSDGSSSSSEDDSDDEFDSDSSTDSNDDDEDNDDESVD